MNPLKSLSIYNVLYLRTFSSIKPVQSFEFVVCAEAIMVTLIEVNYKLKT
jgi:hypothetical protein